MAIRKQTIRHLSLVARKIARLVNGFQRSRRPNYLLLNIQDLEHFVNAYAFYEKEMKNVQPEDPGRSDSEDIQGSKKARASNDQVGERSHRASLTRKRRRPRNKRKKLKKGARKP